MSRVVQNATRISSTSDTNNEHQCQQQPPKYEARLSMHPETERHQQRCQIRFLLDTFVSIGRKSRWSIVLVLILSVLSRVSSVESTIGYSPKEVTSIKVPESSLLLICTLLDGKVVSLASESGDVVSFFDTGRDLVSTRTNERVVPDLTGRLYWKRTMQRIPVTMDDILQNPLQTCAGDDDYDNGHDYDDTFNENNEQAYAHNNNLPGSGNENHPKKNSSNQCGIVTGSKLTSFYGMDAHSGSLVWTSHATTSPDSSASGSIVVLQRDDYIVQQISTDTGRQVWNVTLGRFSALEFSPPQRSDPVFLLEGTQDEHPHCDVDESGYDESDPSEFFLPLISFDDTGRILTIFDAETRQIRWRRELPQVIAGVYGLQEGAWIPLEEIQDEIKYEKESGVMRLLLPSSNTRDDIYHLLLQQQRLLTQTFFDDSRLVVYQSPSTSSSIKGRRTPNPVISYFERDPDSFHPDVTFPVDSPPQLYYPVYPPAIQPAGGLFLSWPVLGAIVVTAIFGAFGFLWMYFQNKTLQQASTPVTSHRQTPHDSPPILHLDRHHSAPIEGSHTYWNGKRSISLPALREQNMKRDDFALDDGENTSQQSLNAELSLSQKSISPPLTNLSTSHEFTNSSPTLEPSTLEGIPLVRYSRYRSEFQELGSLGKGGFGSVFECKNLLDGRKYAIKKVAIQLFDDPQRTRDRLQRVLREVKILALLDHPNIVRYYTAWMEVEESSGESQGSTMGYDENGSSSKLLSKCYSSSLLTEHLLDERMSASGKTKGKKLQSSNPLGWNTFLEDVSEFSLERRNSVESLTEYGFQFERNEVALNDSVDFSESSIPKHVKRDAAALRKTVQFESMNSNSNSTWSSLENSQKDLEKASPDKSVVTKQPKLRHILYIQMQLCGQKTLANFLSNSKARKTPGGEEMDMHYALKLFLNVAKGVKYVHSQGLIHRDLKPNNCFLDDSGIVKVGDFGLSRETNQDETEYGDDAGYSHDPGGEENTAGVGTRAYASPEQLNGSDYDNSTDIFSLGFILFELTFEMSTGMERHIMFSRLREGVLPDVWVRNVTSSFPVLPSLLSAMVSPKPSHRPSAEAIVRTLDKLLGEFTVQSLDQNLQNHSSTLLLRVEAEPQEGVLNQTIQIIKDSAPGAKIEQYGLRSNDSSTVIEFALSGTNQVGLDNVLDAMKKYPDIIKGCRQVYDKNTRGRSLSMAESSREGEGTSE
jgi:serine/threonine protein kinase